ncbi:MAG: diaminopimelate epimerase [Desulfobacterales bacterium]|uniref:Diaminopimelate epimerase n=1 Tax=Candidatus Desulfaltia bathyphila TaxID=2841697 RepID=A0A8J6TC66_9BACT|nr:diaminopimelate epimerase [Candidatus Desulfaltia bathyphila]MBL7194780.1 diaminopimelate epimerase [Desulfobacterales bacterium]MBL7207177.1 diaminopimelate epimerase [Desulfobacterales bacterium]
MKHIEFFKVSGSGNDFIIIDNRDRIIDEKNLKNFVANVCRRKMSVGADGFILIEKSDSVDFRWRFFNADGNPAEMCGNGARCAARFAYLNRIAGSKMSFETEAGIVSAKVSNDLVKINIPEPAELKTDYLLDLENGALKISSINTGVPHVVIVMDSIDNVDVVKLGREIRFHDMFAPAGTNVNFICQNKDDTISIRTYERGVEDETLACGTGAVAAAIVTAFKFGAESPVRVITKSGESLYIYYKVNNGKCSDVYLEGDARIIYKGELYEDAWEYSL